MAVHFNISFFLTIIFVFSMSFFINAQNFKRENQGVSSAIFVKASSVKLNAVKLASLEIPKLECIFQCVRNHECLSVNVGASTVKKHVCELLGTDKFKHSSSLIQDPEFDHYYIEVRKLNVVFFSCAILFVPKELRPCTIYKRSKKNVYF